MHNKRIVTDWLVKKDNNYMQKKHFKAMELNCLDEITIQNIREWRNQDFVRKNMFHQDIIGEEEHNRWIQRVKDDQRKHLFVFYLDDEPFGVEIYTYNEKDDYVEIGNYLTSIDYQAMGYGVIMSYFGLDIMYNVLGYERMESEILEYNKRAGLNRFFNEKEEYREKAVSIKGKEYNIRVVRGTKNDWDSFEKAKLAKLVKRFVFDDYEVIK